MKRIHQLSLFAVAAASMAMVGCSSKITQEQLTELQNLKQQESTLRQQVASKEQEKNRLQSEVNARKGELDQCNKNRQFVEGKLAVWPDVWPDWKDTPPAPTTTTPRRR
jgi:outer membrane murein-binding lipoprotein Lpp